MHEKKLILILAYARTGSNYFCGILDNTFKDITEHTYTIHLNGLDSEGIVYKITNQLAELNINIEELETNIQNAPMSGLTLFSLTAKITHLELDYNILVRKMNALASELDVNIIVED